MSPVEVTCPGCGAPIVFRLGSSMVTVCEYCHSVVGRGDRDVDDLGKVAFLAETDSPLEVGLRGRFQGHGFEVLGAARLQHEAGGVWDEWYLAFDDDRWGWLAEAQGRFYLTFAVPFKAKSELPAFEALPLAQRIRVRPEEPPMLVAEKGVGRPVAARGEIPYRLVPGEDYEYADLSGPAGRFGTLDYSESPPLLYLGQEVTLDELNLPQREEPAEHELRQVEAVHVACPRCGGSLDLQAPDKTERVGCPFCGALSEANEGNLKLLKAVDSGPIKFALPIGSKGLLGGVEYLVIGYMLRAIKLDIWYQWGEYLLYNQRLGFRWLECSDDHWSFVEPLPPASVTAVGNNVYYDGKRFRWFQKGDTKVKAVIGEFYWKVEIGEQVQTTTFVRPPDWLSREYTTRGVDKGEVSWSRGTYLPVEEVERAFKLTKPLRRPSTIAPNQPFPYWGVYSYWAVFATLVVLLGLIFWVTSRKTTLLERSYAVKAAANDEAQVVFGGPFSLQSNQNVQVEASTTATNFWLWIDGDLSDEKTGTVQGFSVPLEYYAGIEGGESWSEGSKRSAAFVSALPAGEYSLRLEIHSDPKNPPVELQVRVRQDVPRLLHWFLALVAVSAIPLLVLAYHISFESRRWRDSS